ncbi:MAG: hypothetical protein D6768_11150 [Chloroflexi bacterium]|nr:MAG: hypothetical protein D6768_11150 [Chloroflexota bacterium]
MATVFCLDCDREIDLEPHAAVGQRIKCPHCDVILELINVNPVELDWVYDGPVSKSGLIDEWWPSTPQWKSPQTS